MGTVFHKPPENEEAYAERIRVYAETSTDKLVWFIDECILMENSEGETDVCWMCKDRLAVLIMRDQVKEVRRLLKSIKKMGKE